MSAVAAAAILASTGGPRIILVNDTDSKTDLAPVTLTVFHELTNTGAINNSLTELAKWITPQIGMANYEVFATLNSGSLTSGSTGAWLNLGTTRKWGIIRSTVGASSANLTLQIRRVGTAITLATSTVQLSANVEL